MCSDKRKRTRDLYGADPWCVLCCKILPVELDLITDQRDREVFVAGSSDDTHDRKYYNGDLNKPSEERNAGEDRADDEKRHTVIYVILNISGLSYVCRDDVEQSQKPEDSDI